MTNSINANFRQKPLTSNTGPNLMEFLYGMRKNTVLYFHDLMLKYGDLVTCGVPFNFYLINHSQPAKHVLQFNNKNYSKKKILGNKVEQVFGKGIVTSEGSQWLNQRRTIHPALNQGTVEKYHHIILGQTAKFLNRLKVLSDRNEPLKLLKECRLLVLDIIGQAFFNYDFAEKRNQVYQAISTGNDYLGQTSLLDLPPWFPTTSNLTLKKALKSFDTICDDIIQHHQNTPAKSVLLEYLLNGYFGKLDNLQAVREEIRTLIITGHVTTGDALSWMVILLDQNPIWKSKMRDEFRLSQESEINCDPKLQSKVATRVINEALRLYPPVWGLCYKAKQEDTIDGVKIPKGALVFIDLFNIHRNPGLWELPDKFNPDRFQQTESHNLPGFMPFGAGPRKCIGSNFSLLIMSMVLPMLIKCFDLRLKNQSVEIKQGVTVNPGEDLEVEVRLKDQTVLEYFTENERATY